MIDDQVKEDIRSRTDLFELCEALGLQPKGKVARCPAHADQGRPNLHLYPKEVHCFACNWHADAFDLVAKVKGFDFPASFDFLAVRLGLPLVEDMRKKGQRLGNGNGATVADTYPKPSPLPATPSPTLGKVTAVETVEGSGLGYETLETGAPVYPKPPAADQVKPSLPVAQWGEFADFGDAWAYFDSLQGYRRGLAKKSDVYVVRGLDAAGRVVDVVFTPPPVSVGGATVALPNPAGDRLDDQVGRAATVSRETTGRRPRRVEVFAALLDQAKPSSTTAAGDWLHREKGISPATQDRYGLCYLDDPKAAAVYLVNTFGLEALLDLGIYGRDKDGKPYFAFKNHRLLFPFFWRGEPVDVQGRDHTTTDKGFRFRNTNGKNPLPYNADALLDAKATGSPVFLCEGATDTLTLAQSGRLAVGIVGTGGFKAEWLEAFAGLDVYLAFDGDGPGRKAAKDVTKVFVDGGHKAPKTIRLPDSIKDVTELFRSNPQ